MEPEADLEAFIAKYAETVATQIRAVRAAMRSRLPSAVELVYDNYNALAIGYSTSEKLADVVFSVAAYPRWVSLFFVGGTNLDDPKGLLKGKGVSIRHIVLAGPETLDDPDVRALMNQALARSGGNMQGPAAGRLVIKSISAKQRPRRP